MPGLRCVVIDPGQDATAELRYLLETDPRTSEISIVPRLEQAITALEDRAVDAVFICLAQHTGNQLNTLVELPWRPAIIALAPSPDYAVAAFDIGAVDFVIKPAGRRAITRAIDRLEEARASRIDPSASRIPIQREDRLCFVDARDVYFIESDGDYTVIRSSEGTDYCRESLSNLAERLAPYGFLRIHRRWLISANRVEHLGQTDGKLYLHIAGQQLPVARRLATEVKARLT